ncbi:MAG: hypothetical protein M3N08_01190 [Pseudomonadota bacterium]|nr:hypothetical protein [Pseudomonadota bacterium]
MADKHPHTHAGLKQAMADNVVPEAVSPNKPPYTPEQLKMADERVGIIQLITGLTADGHDFYAYVSLRPSLYDEYCRKVEAKEKVDVEKFGRVLKKGFGKEPPEDVKRYMHETFGIDPDFLEHFAEEVEKKLKEQQDANQ